MEFLNNWKINLEKLPTYSKFKVDFNVECNYDLLNEMYNSDHPEFTDERKSLLKNLMDKVDKKKNIVKVKHSNRYGLGRWYPDNSISPISISRHFKHTLFTFQDWIDLDMVKGHPTMLFEVGKRNGETFLAFQEYLSNPSEIFKELIEYYSVNEEIKLSEDNIKDIFNILIYGGGHSTWLKQMAENRIEIKTDVPHQFVNKFKDDCKRISDLVYINNIDIVNRVKGTLTDENEIKRRTMSYWCGTIENHIIYLCDAFLKKENVLVKNQYLLEYDGICLKRPERNDLEYVVEELNKHIFKKTGLNIKMIWKNYKPKYVHLDIINKVKQLKEGKPDECDENFNSFEKVSAEFEKNHCKIINKGIFIKTTETGFIPMSKQHIRTSYEHITFDEYEESGDKRKIVKRNFIQSWLVNNASQLRYDDVKIYPTGTICPNNIFNLWTDFEMEKIEEYVYKKDELQKIRNHIKILCGNNEGVFDFIEKWIAQMIQFPAVKSICPILISKEGAGKGTLLTLLKKMLGYSKVFETTNPSRDVWGDFNGLMAHAFLVNLNELSKKDTLEAEGLIKGLVTDPELTINNKGIDPYQIQSYHRFIITTNKEEPVNSKKDDRRNLVIRSSDEKIGDKEYFCEMHSMLNDVNVIKTCYEYFKSIPDMDKFGTLPLPQTEYHSQLKELSVSPIEKWLEAFTITCSDRDIVEHRAEMIYEMFKHWCSKNGIHYECNCLQLMVRLHRLNIKGVGKRKDKTGNVTLFDVKELEEYFGLNCLL